MNTIDELLKDSVDIHVHCGPDPRVERRNNAVEIAMEASKLGMKGIVLKAHEYPTQPVAYTVSAIVPDLHIMGGICADFEVGGLNPLAIEASAQMGAKIVWMPTYSAYSDRSYRGLEGGISILDDNDKLLPEVDSIINIAKDYDMVLATGHISTKESISLITESLAQGLDKIVLTHGTTSAHWTGITVDEMKKIASKGVFVEHCVHVLMPTTYRLDPKELVETIYAIGVENCILSTDFGQNYHPMPAEGFRMGMGMLSHVGMSDQNIKAIVSDNPSALLGI